LNGTCGLIELATFWMYRIGMTAHARMTVPEFLAWTEKQPRGRYELWNGQPIEMSPERARHAKTKFAIATALAGAIREAGLACHMLPDGMTVRIDDQTAYEPDALVYCGDELPGDAVIVPDPVILVEVASPGTASMDTGVKLADYFALPSVMHYLILDPERRVITHHARRSRIETAIIRDGEVRLEPPGIVFPAESAFAR
jgi:Uma2 family endonuclease